MKGNEDDKIQGREKAGGGGRRTDNKPNMPGQAAPNNTVKIRQLKIFLITFQKRKEKEHTP